MVMVLSASTWTALGVVLGLVGVLILFRYGMPFRVRSDGVDRVVVSSADADEELALDSHYTLMGYVGLALTVAGGICQIIAAYSPP